MLVKKSKLALFLCVATAGFLVLSACSPAQSEFSKDGWTISADRNAKTLNIRKDSLGILIQDAELVFEGKDRIATQAAWSIKKDNSSLIIRAKGDPSVSWTFAPAGEEITIECSEPGALLKGKTPGGEKRIPARTQDQDNGIMYTSLGRISAAGIHCLFDRPTDTLIRFPGPSRLSPASAEGTMDIILPAATGGSRINLIEDYYIKKLGLKYYKPMPQRFPTAAVAWSSWYCYYMGTTEGDLIRETDSLAKHLKPYGLEYVQLDACYTRGEDANYLEWNKKAFPRGGQWIFNYIQSKGLKPALWVNIYGSNYAKAESAEKYPDNFYLRDKDGNLSGACCTADKTVVRLDYSNPDVIEKHLKPMFRTLKEEWGLKYLKDAGWGTWMDYYEKNRDHAFDSSRDGREVYLAAQKALRETLGDDVFIGGCAMHEVGLGFGIFDGSRVGGDDKAVWYPERKGGMSMQTYFHSLFGGNYLNNIVWHCDPDAAMVRNPLTYEEAKTIVTAMGLTGQLYMASDFMDRLPKRKLRLYQKTIPTTPIVPVDLYPYKDQKNMKNGVIWCCPHLQEFPRALDCKINALAGSYDVAAVFNWGDETAAQGLSFAEDLGLEADRDYAVFNFWDQKFEGLLRNGLSAEIPAHGTRVFVIKPVLDHPQVIATSRHITGTVSLKSLAWDEGNLALKGASAIVPHDDYSLFVHIPEGFKLKSVGAKTEVLFQRMDGPICEIRLSGNVDQNQNPVAWALTFSK